MPALMPCPDAHELERYLLGLTPDPDASRLDDHVGACAQCARAAGTLSGSDELIDAVRNAPERLRQLPRDEAVQQLIARLKRLACVVDDATVPSFSSAEDMEATQEFFDLLSPQQAPGELGRLGPYRILKMIGAGGMGVVFEAEDPHLERRVAVKAMRRSLATNASARARFLREARTVAALEHDHIVTVLQAGEDQGVLYLAMPLLKGESLDDRLKREERLAPAEALRIAREAAEGLAAAHERGLVHRDIKPGNIWLESVGGRVKLLDFGLAKAMDEAADLTHQGTITGTPQYMSPEQTRGGAVMPRSDLFSLGCVLYQMLTGVAPFRGPDPIATLLAVAAERPVSPEKVVPGVPRAISELVLRLLAKAPEDRPESARAVVEAIRVIERASLAPAAPRRPGRAALVFAGAVVLAALAGPVIYVNTGKGKIVVRVDPSDVRITVDGEPREGVTITVRSGTHTVRVEKEGFAPFRTDVRIWRGSQTEVPAVLKPEARPRGDTVAGLPNAPAGQYDEQFPGFVPAPAPIPGIHRWQIAGRFPCGWFTDLAWSPDGTRLVVCASDQVVRVYDGETLRLLRAWPFPWVKSVAWSGDGRWIAAGSFTGAVGLWSADDGSPQPAPEALPAGAFVMALAFSPDSRTLAVASRFRKELRLWDVVRRAPAPALEHPDVLQDVCWSPDGKSLATASLDKLVRVWDVGKAEVIRTFEGHIGPVHSVAFTSDGQRVVSAADDRRVRVWNLARGEEERAWQSSPNSATIGSSVATSKDGLTAYVALGDPDIYVRSLDDGGPRTVLGGRTGHQYQFPFPHAIRFRFDGARLASINQDASLRVWDVKSGALVGAVESHSPSIRGLASDPAGTMLAAGTVRGDAARVWNASNGRLRITLSGRPSRAVQGVAFSPDGRTIAIGCGANPIYLRGEPEPNSVRLFAADGTPGRTFSDLSGAITALAFLSDGRRLATGGQGSPLQIWDRDTGSLLRTIPTDGWAELIAFAPDGRRFAKLIWPNGLQFWDVESGAAGPERQAGDGEIIEAVAWHPAGKTIATAEHGSAGAGIRIRDAAHGAVLFTLLLRETGAVTFDGDGRLVAGGNGHGDVRVWDAANGTPLLGLSAGRAGVRGVCFLSNPLRIAAGTEDGAVRIWDAKTGAPLFVLLALSGEHAATIEPDGRLRVTDPKAEDELIYLVREKEDGPVRMLTPAEFRAAAEHAKTRRPATTPPGAESNRSDPGRPPQ